MKRKMLLGFIAMVLVSIIFASSALAATVSIPWGGGTATGTSYVSSDGKSASGSTSFSGGSVDVKTKETYYDALFQMYGTETKTKSGTNYAYVSFTEDGLRYDATDAASDHNVYFNGQHLFFQSHT